MTPTVNTNGSLLKFEDTTLTKMKTLPVVSKIRIKSKFKAKTLTGVRSTRAKNKSKTTIENIPQKTKTKIYIKSVDRIGSACTNTKNPHDASTKYEEW